MMRVMKKMKEMNTKMRLLILKSLESQELTLGDLTRIAKDNYPEDIAKVPRQQMQEFLYKLIKSKDVVRVRDKDTGIFMYTMTNKGRNKKEYYEWRLKRDGT